MRRLRALLVSLTVAAAGLGSIVLSAGPADAAVPAGFNDQLVASVASPTSMAFTPDGRMLVTTQGGTVRVVQGGVLLGPAAIDLSAQLCSNSERGLLGIAVDPAFTTNGYVFLYYSFKKNPACDTATVNRVSRFVMSGNTLAGETVLIDNIPSPAGNHNAGDLHFGKDNLLYVSVGDGGCDYPGGTPSGCAQDNDASRDQNALVGKILRIDRNGNIPAGNPFQGAGTARCNAVGVVAIGLKCQETFAWGLRNPFRMAFDPNAAGTRFYIDDVGQATWEEIDLGTAGADYGWNVREGHCATGSTTDCGPPPTGMTNPIFDYGRPDGCGTITGGAFVPNGVWPSAFDGKYLFADYLCGKIFRLDPNGSGGFNRVDIATGLGGGSAVALAFGPWNGTQALYYTTYASGGQIRRISRTAGVAGEFDGDAKADPAVYRPGNGNWYVAGSTGATTATLWGVSTDIPVPADYDGDGKTDDAVYRPSTGEWFVRSSVTGIGTVTVWGVSTDVPVPADYDGDGKADIAVYRPSTGQWFDRSSVTGGGVVTLWGTSTDIPVPADYDGDGKADIAVYRRSTGEWFDRSSVTGFGVVTVWGVSTDIPVPADYDGDGQVDVAVYRPSTGQWFDRSSATGGGVVTVFGGLAGDVPVPADYTGDNRADLAVYRPSNTTWYVHGSDGVDRTVLLGASGDVVLQLPYAVRTAFF